MSLDYPKPLTLSNAVEYTMGELNPLSSALIAFWKPHSLTIHLDFPRTSARSNGFPSPRANTPRMPKFS